MSLFKLEFRNIKKSIKDYSIYFITLVIAISIFYLFNSLDSQTAMLALNESTKKMVQALVNVISSLSIFVAIVLGFLIVYANNFIIKRRKKEIGIYLMLGMSNVKVSMILVLETILVGIISLITGILIGIGLSQLVSVFVAKLFEADMTKFSFVFSSDALIWSVISFSLIYVIVTTFNLITLNRFKLIDLLSAKRKNEKVRIKNNWLILIIFIISLITIGYAYKLLYDGAILIVGNDFIKMIILGSLGTFLFFLSVSGFLLKVISLRKKLYYKDLNIFILKQVSNKINTHVVSTTVISLMLLLTIGILSASLSLANAMNESFSSNTPYDFSAATNEIKNIDELTNSKDYQSIVAKSFQYQSIIFDDLTYSDFISQNNNTPTIAVISGDSDNFASSIRINAAKEAMSKEGLMPFYIFENSGGWDKAKTESDFYKFLKTKPTIDAVLAANDDMAIGAADALAQAGYALSGIPIVGVDATPEGRAAVRDGRIDFTVYQDPEKQGAGAIDEIMNMLGGNTPNVDIDSIQWHEYIPVTAANIDKLFPDDR